MSRLSAREAAQLLGISLPTLYAYVSRGLLRSHAHGTSKRRYYDADDVRLLARRRADAKHAGNVAERSLDWGMPVLESRITQIADGRLSYRGRDAVAFASAATLEDAAALLWACPLARIEAHETIAPRLDASRWRHGLDLWRTRPPLERALALLPLAAPVDDAAPAALLDEAVTLLRLATAALAARMPCAEPAHRQLAAAWRVSEPRDVELLRIALVLCADHELNPSTFAVRCIASTGAPLFGAIAGGLAALSGPRHGGETARVAALLDGAAPSRDLPRYVAAQCAAYARNANARTSLPGFGHPLYPQGDPRAALLIDAIIARTAARPPRARHAPPLEGALALAEAAQAATGEKPQPAKSRRSISRSRCSSARSRCRRARRLRCSLPAASSAGSRTRSNNARTAG